MNLKKTALLLAATALLAASSFATSLPLSAPTFSVVSGGTEVGTSTTYGVATGTPMQVQFTESTSGATCYYDTTGVALTAATASTVGTAFSTPANLSINTTGAKTTVAVKTFCSETGFTSNSGSFTFILESAVGTPTLTPTTSTYAHSVSIADTWTTSTGTHPTILYTIDGSDPATNSAAIKLTYSAITSSYPAIDLGQSVQQVLTVVAENTGYANSAEVSGSYGTAYNTATGVQAFIASGSSAQAAEYALAFSGILGDGVGGACGSHHFSKSNGAQAVDQRGSAPADTGNLVISWDKSTDTTAVQANGNPYVSGDIAAPTKICVFLQLDSTLGVKAFMNSNLAVPSEYLNFLATSGTSNSISPFWYTGSVSATYAAGATPDEAKIPSDVLTAAQGLPFNVGVTDIRPEDAKFATTRALTTLNTTRTGLGYGPGPIGTAVTSEAGTVFNVVDFALSGNDPITGAKQNPYTTIPIGAAPVVVIVNKTVTADGTTFHFSNSEVKNISRFTLAGYFNGSITGTGALATSPLTLASGPVNVWLREPLSGTYNTMEFNIPASKEIGSSQEIGIDPSVKGTCAGGTGSRLSACTGAADANGNSGNPLFIKVHTGAASLLGTTVGGNMIGVNGATRQRAIGTGEMVKQVALTGADNLGYTFWGYGNIKAGNNSADVNTKYLTVDGVDPINAAYSTGAVPTCTATSYSTSTGCPTTLTFPNVINGSYPIWSIYRAVVPNPVPAFVSTVITAAENVATYAQDFAPLTSMQVFRSHYTQAGVTAHNGNVATVAGKAVMEQGGDAGGAVYTIQADIDHVAQYGTEITAVKQ